MLWKTTQELHKGLQTRNQKKWDTTKNVKVTRSSEMDSEHYLVKMAVKTKRGQELDRRSSKGENKNLQARQGAYL